MVENLRWWLMVEIERKKTELKRMFKCLQQVIEGKEGKDKNEKKNVSKENMEIFLFHFCSFFFFFFEAPQ